MRSDLTVREATSEDLLWIYGLRHQVYAQELGQHATDPSGRLTDGLDGSNVYLVAARGDERVGFVSLTPPWVGRYGLDKYVSRDELPLLDALDVFEVRILTVDPRFRQAGTAILLMYAALRWTASRGGRRVVAMGRSEVLDMYRAVGLHEVGRTITSGAVDFEVITATVAELTAMALGPYADVLARLGTGLDWQLDMPWSPRPDGCEHGGASFTAVGTDFRDLGRRRDVVAADVLDAWFSPAPDALAALRDDPAWAARTSPPTDADGLLSEIAEARGLPVASVAVGAGSSDLIFRAFSRWLTAQSRVLLVDPGYGEYAHVTERVIGCTVDRFRLSRSDDWRIDVDRLTDVVAAGGYDLVVVVNPNNPTGRHLPASALRAAVEGSAHGTRWWVDEAYLGYVDPSESLATLAADDDRVVVCTSMSKMFALSGVRAAYLVAVPEVAAEIRRWTPPWAVSLPAQIAAVAALRDPSHYREMWARTHVLRADLVAGLAGLGPDVLVEDGVANFVNLTLPEEGPSAARFVTECRTHGVYLRDLSPLSSVYEGRTVRIAVRDVDENECIVRACVAALAALDPRVPAR